VNSITYSHNGVTYRKLHKWEKIKEGDFYTFKKGMFFPLMSPLKRGDTPENFSIDRNFYTPFKDGDVLFDVYDWFEILGAQSKTKEYWIKKSGLAIYTIDYALPLTWLNLFVEKEETSSSYEMIRSSTIMLYNEKYRHGMPFSCCISVQKEIERYFNLGE